jgi:ABC transporter transmembrane region
MMTPQSSTGKVLGSLLLGNRRHPPIRTTATSSFWNNVVVVPPSRRLTATTSPSFDSCYCHSSSRSKSTIAAPQLSSPHFFVISSSYGNIVDGKLRLSTKSRQQQQQHRWSSGITTSPRRNANGDDNNNNNEVPIVSSAASPNDVEDEIVDDNNDRNDRETISGPSPPSPSSSFHSNNNDARGGEGTSRSPLRIARTLGHHVWPNDDDSPEATLRKRRVAFSVTLMLAGKGVNIQVPYIFKALVDSLPPPMLEVASSAGTTTLDVSTAAAMAPGVPILALLLGYGMSRAAASGFQEWRNAVFANVAQEAIRKVGRSVFHHVHTLDMQFHLSKNTGKVSRILDRGNRSISFVLNAMVFNVIPTAVEVGLVTGLVYYQFGTPHASVVFATIATYTAYTVGITQWRTQFRRDMNRLENEASGRVVDSLVNYETVQFFNNVPHEV